MKQCVIQALNGQVLTIVKCIEENWTSACCSRRRKAVGKRKSSGWTNWSVRKGIERISGRQQTTLWNGIQDIWRGNRLGTATFRVRWEIAPCGVIEVDLNDWRVKIQELWANVLDTKRLKSSNMWLNNKTNGHGIVRIWPRRVMHLNPIYTRKNKRWWIWGMWFKVDAIDFLTTN